MQHALHPTKRPGEPRAPRPEELQTLRKLLVGPEQIGDVLPEIVVHAAQARRIDLATALEKPVSTALQEVARRNPSLFAEILAPTIGTAVRRSIGEAVAKIMQYVNRLLERGMSLRSLRWRLEASRTGRPLAEVVLSHTLIYRVEWVVLIDNATSLVLEEASAPTAIARAPSQTSAMLQAINSFVREAFQPAAPGGELETIEFGDLSVWLERDPAFTLAAAIRGAPPARLRDTFRDALARIRTLHGDPVAPVAPLAAASYAETHSLLAECLEEQQRAPAPKRAQWLVAAAGIAALLAISTCSYHLYTDKQRDAALRTGYLAALESEPGIVVTGIERGHHHYRIKGLSDPRAPSAAGLIARAGLPTATLDFAPFISADPRLPPSRPARAP